MSNVLTDVNYLKQKLTMEDLFNENISQIKMRNFLKIYQIHRLNDKLAGNYSCEDSYVYKLLMGKIFLFVFAIALIGNITNILIYNRDHYRSYITIKLLCSKLILNTIALILLLPHTLRILGLWESGSKIDYYYYMFWPFELFFVNLFGFCSTWITVLMTAECVITSYVPGYSKIICTKRNVLMSYAILGILGTLMAIIYPLNRKAIFNYDNGKTKVFISTSDNIILGKIEKFHTIVNLCLTVVLPLILLITLTVILFYRFALYRKTRTGVLLKFTKEKKCVVKISVLTTILFILCEIPAVPVFISSFTKGIHVVNQEESLCRWLSFSHFCGICNSSLSFLIYFIFSKRFRQSFINVVKIIYNNYIEEWINRFSSTISKKEIDIIEKSNSNLNFHKKFQTTKRSLSKSTLFVTQKVIITNSRENQHDSTAFVQLLPMINGKTISENSIIPT